VAFSRGKNATWALWRFGKFPRGKAEAAAGKALVLRLVFQVEPLHVIFEVFERAMGADQILLGIPVIHDEEFPSQVKAAQIMNMGPVRGNVDDPGTVVGIDPVQRFSGKQSGIQGTAGSVTEGFFRGLNPRRLFPGIPGKAASTVSNLIQPKIAIQPLGDVFIRVALLNPFFISLRPGRSWNQEKE
jgi:hypothetical protein